MIHGLIVLNKPRHITSHDVVDKIRAIFKIKKVGHFGTLDPLAEGLLLVGLGKAAKFFYFYIKKEKRYSGIIKFGYATSTYDGEGVPISEKKEIDLNRLDIP
ncbi:MAG: tRNA pseudouridine(55) synthase TruB, partial [Candidatus Aminicenantes bacterium]|nr:tRNA pseudouridine(55) synthase TruB [Candidatus Aminicenantes bacterium]